MTVSDKRLGPSRTTEPFANGLEIGTPKADNASRICAYSENRKASKRPAKK